MDEVELHETYEKNSTVGKTFLCDLIGKLCLVLHISKPCSDTNLRAVSDIHFPVLPRAVTPTVPLISAAPSPGGVAEQVQILPTLPSSIREMEFIVNANLDHKRQAHHVTKPQTASVQELFGNVRMLVDLVPPLSD